MSAPQLLRFVVETPAIQERLHRCDGCKAEVMVLGSPAAEGVTCYQCGRPSAPLGAGWWARAAQRMRAACRRDRQLLGRIKAEWRARYGDIALPSLPEPFAWLNRAWPATTALGRPLESTQHFTLAHIVGRLQAAGASLNQIFTLASLADQQRRREEARKLPAATIRFLGQDFKRIVEQLPVVSDRAEFRRRLRWAERQWIDPRARLAGERVRRRPRA